MSATSSNGSLSLPALDWRRMPLQGRTLIEASAGTGKTWNIGLIYLRLLLELDLRAEQILVTTFTDAAAQELRERLRLRLIEAERLLRNAKYSSDAADESLESYLAALCTDEEKRQRALRKVQLARADLDRAPISTIHALCQRIQRDYPLESGAVFANDKLFDEQQLLRECVEDFWRRRYLVGDVDPREASLLLKAGPEGLLRDLTVLNNSSDALVEAGGLTELQRLIASLQAPEVITELERLGTDKVYYGPRKTALRNRIGKAAIALRDNDEDGLTDVLDDAFERQNVIEQEATASAGTLNAHGLIIALQTLRALLKSRVAFTRGTVLAAAADFCREEMPRRAQQRHVLTFSMLIDAVYQRLCGNEADNVLANRLFNAFPVALIDEFQDTDQRQFAIFDRIYRDRGTLVMIGDPKQAIYSFRGGDIAAYLRASRQADRRFSLATNYRSSRALVEAINAWYAATDGGFAHPQIRYQPVNAAGRADEKPWTIDGATVSQPLVIHAFRDDASGSKGKSNSRGALEALALDDCANRIAELLNDPRQRIDDRRVMPGDVAVLLSTNSQIVALRARLIARGVPCVGSGRGNIFAGDVAREFALIFHAVIHANDDTAVRGALSTRLLGADIEQFAEWQTRPEGFERELERFDTWRTLTHNRGALALVEALLILRGTALLAQPDGERTLTDLRHLGELLAAEESSRQGLDGLYAWLIEMRQAGEDGDADAIQERQLRIESDAQRVQLLTIHASKGLEFPIVFLPLAWRVSDRSGQYAPGVLRYHDDAGRRRIDLGSADFIEHRAAHFREELEERLRLLYVAMTRAIHGVHVYWVDRGERSSEDQFAWQWAAIDRLILAAQARRGLVEGEASLPQLIESLVGMRLSGPFAGGVLHYQSVVDASAPRAIQAPAPSARTFEWLHSFSALTRHASAALVVDENDASDESDFDDYDVNGNEDDQRLLALFPWRGPRFGDAVHHVLESAGPSAIWPDQRQLLRNHLASQAIKSQGLPVDEMLERIGRLIDRARQADLGDGLRLIDVQPDQRIVEFEFQFPVHRVSLARLRQLCVAHGEAAVVPASLDAGTLNGMLTGFADLIVAHDGRFHVLDYKTNWLGARLQNYRGGSLTAAMREHHYPLQAMLYTVALHRYLRQRMDGYTAQRHLGDSRYLFVRALGLEPGLAIWRHRWPDALIEALDDAFADIQDTIT